MRHSKDDTWNRYKHGDWQNGIDDTNLFEVNRIAQVENCDIIFGKFAVLIEKYHDIENNNIKLLKSIIKYKNGKATSTDTLDVSEILSTIKPISTKKLHGVFDAVMQNVDRLRNIKTSEKEKISNMINFTIQCLTKLDVNIKKLVSAHDNFMNLVIDCENTKNHTVMQINKLIDLCNEIIKHLDSFNQAANNSVADKFIAIKEKYMPSDDPKKMINTFPCQMFNDILTLPQYDSQIFQSILSTAKIYNTLTNQQLIELFSHTHYDEKRNVNWSIIPPESDLCRISIKSLVIKYKILFEQK